VFFAKAQLQLCAASILILCWCWCSTSWLSTALNNQIMTSPHATVCRNDSHSTFDILKSEFDAAYRGNRAPFPIFIHFYWLDAADNLEQLRKFVGEMQQHRHALHLLLVLVQCMLQYVHCCLCAADYTLALPDVYYITIRQLLGWMADPLPKDQLTPEALGCGSPGGAPRDTIAEQRRRQLLMRLGGA
jgi:hypothetical protein